jgi:hypothetical protein
MFNGIKVWRLCRPVQKLDLLFFKSDLGSPRGVLGVIIWLKDNVTFWNFRILHDLQQPLLQNGHILFSIHLPFHGSLMVWGCIEWNGVGVLSEVEGQMDAEQYVAILEQGLLQIMEDSGIPEGDIIFQPDNDPKHTSRRAQI